jgi:atypical dual specificity phosphatase
MTRMLVNFSWVEEGRIAAMGLPGQGGWREVERQGIGAVLCLTEHPTAVEAERRGLAVCHIPLEDFGAPSTETLRLCVEFLDHCVAAGRAVVVHCLAGRGRTGTVIAAWYAAHGMDPDEAVARVRALRPGSIETRGQEDAVRALAREAEGPVA